MEVKNYREKKLPFEIAENGDVIIRQNEMEVVGTDSVIGEDGKSESVSVAEYQYFETVVSKECDKNADFLSLAKQVADNIIDNYDNSIEVNEFTYNGISCWFEPDKRKGYEQSLLSCKTLGVDKITVPMGDNIIEMKVSDAEIMLAKVNLYADACYINKIKNKALKDSKTSVSDIASFIIGKEYTKGYPDKLNL